MLVKLKPNSSHAASLLSGQTDTYSVALRLPPPPQTASITVKLRRKGGDPLLMVRAGADPPAVPRRSKILADAWDQEAFDSERNEHSVSITLPAGCDTVCLGVCNYSAHRRETCYYTITTTLNVSPAPKPESILHRHPAVSTPVAQRAAAAAASRASAAKAASVAAAATATTPRSQRRLDVASAAIAPLPAAMNHDDSPPLTARAGSSTPGARGTLPNAGAAKTPQRRVNFGSGVTASGGGCGPRGVFGPAFTDGPACDGAVPARELLGSVASLESVGALRRNEQLSGTVQATTAAASQPAAHATPRTGGRPTSAPSRTPKHAAPPAGGLGASTGGVRKSPGGLSACGGVGSCTPRGGMHPGSGRGGMHPPLPLHSDASEATIISSSTCLGGPPIRPMRAPPLYASSSSASSTAASRIARPSRARAPPTPATLRASHAPLDFAAGDADDDAPQDEAEEALGNAVPSVAVHGSASSRLPLGGSFSGEAHEQRVLRTELGARVDEIEKLHSSAGRLEHRVALIGDRRELALDVAATLATLGCRHRLLTNIFMRWVRACALRPARHLAYRNALEVDVLAHELFRVEGVSAQSEQLAEAAELHVFALREQLALCSHADGDSATGALEQLRSRLTHASAEVERLQVELDQSRHEVVHAHEAAARAVEEANAARDEANAARGTHSAEGAAEGGSSADHLIASRLAADASADGDHVPHDGANVAERLRARLHDSSSEVDRLSAALSEARDEAARAHEAAAGAAQDAEEARARADIARVQAEAEVAAMRAENARLRVSRPETPAAAMPPPSPALSDRDLEQRAAKVLMASADENGYGGAGLPGLKVVARELDALDQLSEQIASTVRRRRATRAAGDAQPAVGGAALAQWINLANTCEPPSPARQGRSVGAVDEVADSTAVVHVAVAPLSASAAVVAGADAAVDVGPPASPAVLLATRIEDADQDRLAAAEAAIARHAAAAVAVDVSDAIYGGPADSMEQPANSQTSARLSTALGLGATPSLLSTPAAVPTPRTLCTSAAAAPPPDVQMGAGGVTWADGAWV